MSPLNSDKNNDNENRIRRELIIMPENLGRRYRSYETKLHTNAVYVQANEYRTDLQDDTSVTEDRKVT